MIQRGSFVPMERVNITRSSYRCVEGQKTVHDFLRRKRRRKIQLVVCIWLIILVILLVAGIATIFKKEKSSDKGEDTLPANETPIPTTPKAKEQKGANGKLIVVDPGHGGHDPGAGDTVYEKEINLAIAQKLKEMLTNAGYKVIMTRESDTAISLEERAELSNQHSADLFISIHQNALENDSVTDWSRDVLQRRRQCECAAGRVCAGRHCASNRSG